MSDEPLPPGLRDVGPATPTWHPMHSYAATEGPRCPACGGADLARGHCDDAAHATAVRRRWACENCAATWTAVYVLAGYADLCVHEEEAP